MPSIAAHPQLSPAAAPLPWLPTDARTVRGVCAVVFLGAALVLALSYVLAPSPTGHGTHTQLLLAPCLMYYLTGVPCPFCGMTTAFCHLARGEVAAAFGCHVLGPALWAVAWCGALLGLVGLVTGRFPFPAFVASSKFQRGVLVVILLAWGVQVWRHLS